MLWRSFVASARSLCQMARNCGRGMGAPSICTGEVACPLAAPSSPGRRGSSWRKVGRFHTESASASEFVWRCSFRASHFFTARQFSFDPPRAWVKYCQLDLEHGSWIAISTLVSFMCVRFDKFRSASADRHLQSHEFSLAPMLAFALPGLHL